MDETLQELGVELPDEKKPPFEKVYFNGEMLARYEPCMESLQNVVDTDGEDDDSWKKFEETFGKFMDFSWLSTWDGKKYDIVFYGVSGYTGYLMMEYLRRVALKRSENFTFAFAGRTASKVAAMRDREFAGTQYADTPILSANYDEPVTMIDLAKSAKVILNVAGPYMLTPGEIMLDACCYTGTHYLDINGEIPWFFRTFDLDKRARAANTLIIPSSAPAGGIPDLLIWLCHQAVKKECGENEELRKAVCYTAGAGEGGGFGGGTLATRQAMTAQGDWGRKLMADPFALEGFIPARDNNGLKEVSIKQGTGETVMKIRKEDTDAILSKIVEDKVNDCWALPHTYSYFDTRVIRRTNALLADHCGAPYGRHFNFTMYQPVMKQHWAKEHGDRMPTLDELEGMGTAGIGGVSGEKEVLESSGKYYKQGEGPALEDVGEVWISWLIYVESVSGHVQRNCIQGNDAYFETARCAIESCLSVVFDYDKLPVKGGSVTITACAAEPLAKRLINSGMRFKQGKWFDFEAGECKPLPM